MPLKYDFGDDCLIGADDFKLTTFKGMVEKIKSRNRTRKRILMENIRLNMFACHRKKGSEKSKLKRPQNEKWKI